MQSNSNVPAGSRPASAGSRRGRPSSASSRRNLNPPAAPAAGPAAPGPSSRPPSAGSTRRNTNLHISAGALPAAAVPAQSRPTSRPVSAGSRRSLEVREQRETIRTRMQHRSRSRSRSAAPGGRGGVVNSVADLYGLGAAAGRWGPTLTAVASESGGQRGGRVAVPAALYPGMGSFPARAASPAPAGGAPADPSSAQEGPTVHAFGQLLLELNGLMGCGGLTKHVKAAHPVLFSRQKRFFYFVFHLSVPGKGKIPVAVSAVRDYAPTASQRSESVALSAEKLKVDVTGGAGIGDDVKLCYQVRMSCFKQDAEREVDSIERMLDSRAAVHTSALARGPSNGGIDDGMSEDSRSIAASRMGGTKGRLFASPSSPGFGGLDEGKGGPGSTALVAKGFVPLSAFVTCTASLNPVRLPIKPVSPRKPGMGGGIDADSDSENDDDEEEGAFSPGDFDEGGSKLSKSRSKLDAATIGTDRQRKKAEERAQALKGSPVFLDSKGVFVPARAGILAITLQGARNLRLKPFADGGAGGGADGATPAAAGPGVLAPSVSMMASPGGLSQMLLPLPKRAAPAVQVSTARGESGMLDLVTASMKAVTAGADSKEPFDTSNANRRHYNAFAVSSAVKNGGAEPDWNDEQLLVWVDPSTWSEGLHISVILDPRLPKLERRERRHREDEQRGIDSDSAEDSDSQSESDSNSGSGSGSNSARNKPLTGEKKRQAMAKEIVDSLESRATKWSAKMGALRKELRHFQQLKEKGKGGNPEDGEKRIADLEAEISALEAERALPLVVGSHKADLLAWTRDSFPHNEVIQLTLHPQQNTEPAGDANVPSGASVISRRSANKVPVKAGDADRTGVLRVVHRFYPAGRFALSILEGRGLQMPKGATGIEDDDKESESDDDVPIAVKEGEDNTALLKRLASKRGAREIREPFVALVIDGQIRNFIASTIHADKRRAATLGDLGRAVWNQTLIVDLVDQTEMRLNLGDRRLLRRQLKRIQANGGRLPDKKPSSGGDDDEPEVPGTSPSAPLGAIGDMVIDLANVYKTGYREAWVPIKTASGGACGEVLIRAQFEAPPGVQYPQLSKGVPTFDEMQRKAFHDPTKLRSIFGEPVIPKKVDEGMALAAKMIAEMVAAKKKERLKRKKLETAVAAAEKIGGGGRADLGDSASVGSRGSASSGDRGSDESGPDDLMPGGFMVDHDVLKYTDEQIREAYDAIDLSKRNLITTAELRHMLICMGEAVTDEELDMMVKLIDFDGDGGISFPEFYAMAKHPHPGGKKWDPEMEMEAANAHLTATKKNRAAEAKARGEGEDAGGEDDDDVFKDGGASVVTGMGKSTFNVLGKSPEEEATRATRFEAIKACSARHHITFAELKAAVVRATSLGFLMKPDPNQPNKTLNKNKNGIIFTAMAIAQAFDMLKKDSKEADSAFTRLYDAWARSSAETYGPQNRTGRQNSLLSNDGENLSRDRMNSDVGFSSSPIKGDIADDKGSKDGGPNSESKSPLPFSPFSPTAGALDGSGPGVDLRLMLVGWAAVIGATRSQRSRLILDLYDPLNTGKVNGRDLLQIIQGNHLTMVRAAARRKINTILRRELDAPLDNPPSHNPETDPDVFSLPVPEFSDLMNKFPNIFLPGTETLKKLCGSSFNPNSYLISGVGGTGQGTLGPQGSLAAGTQVGNLRVPSKPAPFVLMAGGDKGSVVSGAAPALSIAPSMAPPRGPPPLGPPPSAPPPPGPRPAGIMPALPSVGGSPFGPGLGSTVPLPGQVVEPLSPSQTITPAAAPSQLPAMPTLPRGLPALPRGLPALPSLAGKLPSPAPGGSLGPGLSLGALPSNAPRPLKTGGAMSFMGGMARGLPPGIK